VISQRSGVNGLCVRPSYHRKNLSAIAVFCTTLLIRSFSLQNHHVKFGLVFFPLHIRLTTPQIRPKLHLRCTTLPNQMHACSSHSLTHRNKPRSYIVHKMHEEECQHYTRNHSPHHDHQESTLIPEAPDASMSAPQTDNNRKDP
jgi:hypothetical protein